MKRLLPALAVALTPVIALAADPLHKGKHWEITAGGDRFTATALTTGQRYAPDDVELIGAGGVQFAALLLRAIEGRYELTLVDLNQPFVVGAARGIHDCEAMRIVDGGVALGTTDTKVDLICDQASGKERPLSIPVQTLILLPWATDG